MHREPSALDYRHHQECLRGALDIAYALGWESKEEFLRSSCIDAELTRFGETLALQVKTRIPAWRQRTSFTFTLMSPRDWASFQERTGIRMLIVSGEDLRADEANWVMANMEEHRRDGYYFMHSRYSPEYYREGRYEPMRYNLQEMLA